MNEDVKGATVLPVSEDGLWGDFKGMLSCHVEKYCFYSHT